MKAKKKMAKKKPAKKSEEAVYPYSLVRNEAPELPIVSATKRILMMGPTPNLETIATILAEFLPPLVYALPILALHALHLRIRPTNVPGWFGDSLRRVIVALLQIAATQIVDRTLEPRQETLIRTVVMVLTHYERSLEAKTAPTAPAKKPSLSGKRGKATSSECGGIELT